MPVFFIHGGQMYRVIVLPVSQVSTALESRNNITLNSEGIHCLDCTLSIRHLQPI
jgi:hypothetical protein